jgi:ribosome-binding protein aMBF1 (putative translation factor)
LIVESKTMGRKRTRRQTPEIRDTPAGQFGQHLEQLVQSAGLSPKQFGEQIGKSEDAVYHYFNGDRTPHINDWPLIASVLGLDSIQDLTPPHL